VNWANSALAAELDSGKPLSSPAKKFIKCQGRSVKCLYASNSILKYDNTVKDAVISARKRRLSGKRKAIDGKHIISAEELIAIQKAEEMTKQKKVPKRRVAGRKQKRNARGSSNGSEGDIGITDDEGEQEILECIEVEM